LFGAAPFYELPRYDDVYFGGAFGVRGVPSQRFWGKAKILSNLELRSELFSFSFWNKRNIFGLTAFFDSGRVWAGYASHPELDGTGLGLKFGTGAGVRLVAGSSFVLRLDVAYSPDAHPYGIYLTSGHTF
jgi:outer membrane protein assembly factor BamA